MIDIGEKVSKRGFNVLVNEAELNHLTNDPIIMGTFF